MPTHVQALGPDIGIENPAAAPRILQRSTNTSSCSYPRRADTALQTRIVWPRDLAADFTGTRLHGRVTDSDLVPFEMLAPCLRATLEDAGATCLAQFPGKPVPSPRF
jgi:hypothetical protein